MEYKLILGDCLEKLKDIPDIVTVSGLAQGIDSKAHWASIKYEIPTVAVMAISLGQIYPAINKRLSEQILEKMEAGSPKLQVKKRHLQDYFQEEIELLRPYPMLLLWLKQILKEAVSSLQN
jgi:hypothetical protein